MVILRYTIRELISKTSIGFLGGKHRKDVRIMNKNRKIKRGLTTSLAVGMSVMMGAVPVFAAGTSSDADAVYKEETVYVNADATGTIDEVTVSNWLKNSGSVSGSLTDASILKDIKNVKGDETFTTSGDTLTWKTDGEDIYYQGTTDQDLPVSVKLTYYLDGKEIKPADLKGKSGHLKIQVDYTNKEKKTVSVDGKQEEVYTPFVMMTGMILPNETFSNVTIDNGKVISDGSKNIVVGFGMPGMKDSLNLDESKTEDLTIPESLCVEADVTDFTMSSTFTVALTDLLDDIDFDNIVDVDSLQDSLDELEDAALELVSGSNTLADGAGTLADGVNSYTEGADTLNDAIQKYLGSNGELSGSVTEYVNGVNKVVKGVQDYTDGTNTLADGVTAYIGGEQQLAAGAAKLSQLSSGLKTVQGAINQLNAAIDGEGSATEDIQSASKQLAAGTAQLKASLGSQEVQALLGQVENMLTTGNEMIEQTEQLETALNDGIAVPVQNIAGNLQSLSQQLEQINGQLTSLDETCQNAVNDLNAKIADYNNKVDAAQSAATSSKATINSAISELQKKKDQTEDETAKADLQAAIDKLNAASNAADGLLGLEKANEVSVSLPSIDTTPIQKEMGEIAASMETFKKTANDLNTQLPEMKEKLDSITAMKSQLPTEALGQLSASVDQLNAGMQGLNAAIGSFSSNLGTLNESVQAQFPAAVTGILELNGGFSQLSANNDALLAGANKLKANSSTLVAGVQTLQSGTNQLASGLNTLGSQMSSGAAQLSLNSAALREGASAIQSGARELADGMEKFDREGTSKLKSTVEDELGDVLDRFDALTSDDCTYTTFSGKDSGMEGSVKFVIETEAIE